MGTAAQFRMLARYNLWANTRVVEACRTLTEDAYFRDRRAFFGSIHGTLNHLLLVEKLTVDHIIAFERKERLHRGRDHVITALDQILHDRLLPLAEDLSAEDRVLVEFMANYQDADLDRTFTWVGLSGAQRRLFMPHAFENVFLHQTHHRGQVHNMLSQSGIDPPSLDLYVFVEEQSGQTSP